MPKAGYCNECKQNVWLNEDGSCQFGHPASSISNVYDTSSSGMHKKTFAPGGFWSGQQFSIDDTLVSYRSAYGKYATVPCSAIETIAVNAKGRGKSILTFVGKGTVLASIALPNSWAKETQEWLLKELNL